MWPFLQPLLPNGVLICSYVDQYSLIRCITQWSACQSWSMLIILRSCYYADQCSYIIIWNRSECRQPVMRCLIIVWWRNVLSYGLIPLYLSSVEWKPLELKSHSAGECCRLLLSVCLCVLLRYWYTELNASSLFIAEPVIMWSSTLWPTLCFCSYAHTLV